MSENFFKYNVISYIPVADYVKFKNKIKFKIFKK